MRKIFKYPLEIVDEQSLSVPRGAKLLSADVQRDTVCVWAWVDPEVEIYDEVKIHIFGTGSEIPETGNVDIAYRHLGTCVMNTFVWHVFVQTHHAWKANKEKE